MPTEVVTFCDGNKVTVIVRRNGAEGWGGYWLSDYMPARISWLWAYQDARSHARDRQAQP